ncbi:hypothetical protein, partial [Photobacterium swingsii]|uniref:hypothetical protein n=1 Tax=Photobacterium swingsii TaxID=680026 RepID=UPI004068862B
LNPRYATNVCRFSRPVLSTTQPSLHAANNTVDSEKSKALTQPSVCILNDKSQTLPNYYNPPA